MLLAFGMMCAFWERERSGAGQVVDAAMVDGAAALSAMFHGLRAGGRWADTRGSNLLDGGAPFYDCYATQDGRFVAVGALEARFFAELAARIGLDARFVAGQQDRALWPEMRAEMARIFATGTRDAWAALLEGTDCCVTGVLTFGEAAEHPHAAARAAYAVRDGAVHPAAAPRFSRSRPA